MITFAVAIAIGASFWAQRDVTIPCHPQPVVKTAEEMPVVDGLPAEMATVPERCEIWLSPAARYFSHAEPAYFCGEIAHELGHVGGLGHTSGDGDALMDPQHRLGTTDWIPWSCRLKARAKRRVRPPAKRCSGDQGKRPAARTACRSRA